MIKILCIAPYQYIPYFSGGQKLIATFYRYLGDQFPLHVAGTPGNEVSQVNNYSFFSLLLKSRFRYVDLFSFFRLKRLIQQNQINVVIIEHPYLGWLGWMLKISCEVKLVYHTHNIEFERFKSIGKIWWPLLKMYEGWALKQADFVFCISQEDRQGMLKHFNLKEDQCVIVPVGITNENVPTDKEQCKIKVSAQHGFDPKNALLFFNGLLNYKPNLEALDVILQKINPLLLKSSLNYNIIIAGKGLPETYNHLKEWKEKHIHYAGFVEDIDLYTKASDILLNPVTSGGGVKTKMVEAIALNTTVVSTVSGATGINPDVCGNKLIITKDSDWDKFVQAIIKAVPGTDETPEAFYKMYNWKSIIDNISQILSK